MTPKWNKRTKGKRYSRTVVFKTDTSEERDLFLAIAMPMLESIEVFVDAKLERIELTLYGNYEQVNAMIDKLRNLESYVYEAHHPDRKGYYYYHNFLLTKIFNPPLNLMLFSKAIGVFGFESKVVDTSIGTTAMIEEVRSVHEQTVQLRDNLSVDLKRDIERFVLTIALEINTKQPDIVFDTAIEEGILTEDKDGYHLTTSPNAAKNNMLQVLAKYKDEPLEIDEDALEDISIEDLVFDGGKIVFTEEGKEIDQTELNQSFYDGAENNDSNEVEL